MALVRRMERSNPWPDAFVRAPRWPDLFRWPEEMLTPLAAEEPLKVEEFTEDGTLVIKAEMPGIDPEEDVEITASKGALHIRAERKEEKKEESKGGYRTEFHYGAFARTLPLPAGASESDVTATYEDGILEIRVPIDEEKSESTRVPVSKK